MTAYIYEYKSIVFQKLENQNMKIHKLFFNIGLPWKSRRLISVNVSALYSLI